MDDIKTSDYVREYEFKRTEYEPKLQEFDIASTDAAERKVPEDFDLFYQEPPPKKAPGIKTSNKDQKNIGDIKQPGERRRKKPADFRENSREGSKEKKPGKKAKDGKLTREGSSKKRDGRSNAGGKVKRTIGKALRPVSAAKQNLKDSADRYGGSEDPGNSSWDYAAMNARAGKGLKQGFEEVIKLIVKVIKAVASVALLPLIIVMVMVSFIIVAAMSIFSGSSSGSSVYGEDNVIVGNAQEQQMVTEYRILMEYFNGEEIPVIAIMCSIYRESRFYGNNLEGSANKQWNVTDEEYTDEINSGELTREEFDGHLYHGKHYLYWSKKYQDWKEGSCGYGIVGFTSDKAALYDYAVEWFTLGEGAGKDFDISDVKMQTKFVLYQLDHDNYFKGLKEKMISAASIEDASVIWVQDYEKPASDWEWSGKDRAKDAAWIKEKCERLSAGGGENLAWPLPMDYTRITSPFGNRVAPTAGATTYHKGIDIGVPENKAVYASAGGRVVAVQYSSARGYYIRINHGNGISTLYQHLNRQLVKVGDEVEVGEQIALSGNTGITAGPHLHFEVWINGTPVDPTPYLGR